MSVAQTARFIRKVSDAIYTLAEAAKLAKFSEKTLRRCIASGELRASKPRGEYRIRAEWLNDWLDNNVVRADAFAAVPQMKARRRRAAVRPTTGSLRAVLANHDG